MSEQQEPQRTPRQEAQLRVDVALHKIGRHVAASKQPLYFLPHFPRFHNKRLRIDCCMCGEVFSTETLDKSELPRMISWFNSHVSCAVKKEGDSGQAGL